MKPEEIIIAPVITEKSNDGLNEGKYTFEVNPKASWLLIFSSWLITTSFSFLFKVQQIQY